MKLDGKVALVTGSAKRVGRGIALALAEEGASIVVHYGGSREAATQTVSEIETLGVEAFSLSADLADPDQIAALFAAIDERFGRLDILVNSAASFVKQPFDSITVEDWDQVMKVNLRAPFLCSQYAARMMITSERESPALVVNIADLSGVNPWIDFVQHGVSKAGLRHLTAILARELAPDVRVNTLTLGPILPSPHTDPEGPVWKRIVERLPMKRSGSVEEVGQAVVALAQNDFVTGAELAIDGGEHLIGQAND
ncbi:MAG: SDR family oxidoreductase [Anaerolineae bacterium]|nr:SDR family oxidoreductase [Anaerolineae bacterium]